VSAARIALFAGSPKTVQPVEVVVCTPVVVWLTRMSFPV